MKTSQLVKNTPKFRLPPYTVKKVLSTLSQSQGWGLTQLSVPDTWTVTKGENIVVMVIDTGYSNHPDLEENILKDKCRSFVDGELEIADANGHSTHCAGIIGASDNNFGMVGVAPKCKIITVKVLGSDGTGNYSFIKAALRYAKEIKPHVISMSLGAPSGDKELHNLIKDLYNMNIPIIAAAGNDGGEGLVNYPGVYPETICVTAYDKHGNPANFNSTGPEADFSAPGVDIYSTWLNREYASLSGTSMATPFIAGLVALLISKHLKQATTTGKNDCRTVAEIKVHLRKYADNKGIVGHDNTWGYGVVNPVDLINDNDENPLIQPRLTVQLSICRRLWNWLCGLLS